MLQPAHTDHGVATPWDILFLCFAIILYKLYQTISYNLTNLLTC